jgi:hypothetical protein
MDGIRSRGPDQERLRGRITFPNVKRRESRRLRGFRRRVSRKRLRTGWPWADKTLAALGSTLEPSASGARGAPTTRIHGLVEVDEAPAPLRQTIIRAQ